MTECFKIDNDVRQVWIMSPWLFIHIHNVYMDAVMKGLKMEMWRRGVKFQEERRE